LLTFSRQHAFKLETIDPKAIVDDQVRLLKRAMGRKVTLETASSEDVFSVTADSAQLRCALTNLVVNARDAMPDGGAITVRMYNVTLTKQDASIADDLAPGDYAVLEVADTGAGISSEKLSRVFDPFFTTKEVGKGTGLGLSMVYGFIKEMKGHIKVMSEVGLGTTFTLFFSPRNAAAEGRGAGACAGGRSDAGGASTRPSSWWTTTISCASRSSPRSIHWDTAPSRQAVRRRHWRSSPARNLLIFCFPTSSCQARSDGVEHAHLARARRPGLKVILSSGFPDLKSGRSSEDSYEQWQILKKPYRRSELQDALQGILGEDEPHDAQPAAVAS
jgi:two-component system cell cycle sensor histidine kinase/response regulator CckA